MSDTRTPADAQLRRFLRDNGNIGTSRSVAVPSAAAAHNPSAAAWLDLTEHFTARLDSLGNASEEIFAAQEARIAGLEKQIAELERTIASWGEPVVVLHPAARRRVVEHERDPVSGRILRSTIVELEEDGAAADPALPAAD
jgi:hypothetical protein